jgi:hypothetical protein
MFNWIIDLVYGLQVVGNEEHGYNARFRHDKSWCWSGVRENAIAMARKRRKQFTIHPKKRRF